MSPSGCQITLPAPHSAAAVPDFSTNDPAARKQTKDPACTCFGIRSLPRYSFSLNRIPGTSWLRVLVPKKLPGGSLIISDSDRVLRLDTSRERSVERQLYGTV